MEKDRLKGIAKDLLEKIEAEILETEKGFKIFKAIDPQGDNREVESRFLAILLLAQNSGFQTSPVRRDALLHHPSKSNIFYFSLEVELKPETETKQKSPEKATEKKKKEKKTKDVSPSIPSPSPAFSILPTLKRRAA